MSGKAQTDGLTASIFNIERFATEDGPGIRTTVFFKGCSLRCLWCANPESQSFKTQIMFTANLCTACGRCLALCPKKCISLREGFGYISDSTRCDGCSLCAEGCYAGARTVMGTVYTAERLISEVMKDKAYHLRSGGGVTFSGGEPLFYHAFIRGVSSTLREHGLNTLIETCGHVPRENFENILSVTDRIYFDFKHHDPARHKELTGSDNRLILSNLRWLAQNYRGQLSVRYPYIPGRNDSASDIHAFLSLARALGNIAEVWFLPYHRLGLPKYQGLGMEYAMSGTNPLRTGDIAFLMELGDRYALNIRI